DLSAGGAPAKSGCCDRPGAGSGAVGAQSRHLLRARTDRRCAPGVLCYCRKQEKKREERSVGGVTALTGAASSGEGDSVSSRASRLISSPIGEHHVTYVAKDLRRRGGERPIVHEPVRCAPGAGPSADRLRQLPMRDVDVQRLVAGHFEKRHLTIAGERVRFVEA